MNQSYVFDSPGRYISTSPFYQIPSISETGIEAPNPFNPPPSQYYRDIYNSENSQLFGWNYEEVGRDFEELKENLRGHTKNPTEGSRKKYFMIPFKQMKINQNNLLANSCNPQETPNEMELFKSKAQEPVQEWNDFSDSPQLSFPIRLVSTACRKNINGFNLYVAENRKAIKEVLIQQNLQNPSATVNNQQIMNILSQTWKSLPDISKQPFIDKAEQEKSLAKILELQSKISQEKSLNNDSFSSDWSSDINDASPFSKGQIINIESTPKSKHSNSLSCPKTNMEEIFSSSDDTKDQIPILLYKSHSQSSNKRKRKSLLRDFEYNIGKTSKKQKPKRALTAYNIFLQEKNKQIIEGQLCNKEAEKIVFTDPKKKMRFMSQQWKQLSRKEKEKYKVIAKELSENNKSQFTSNINLKYSKKGNGNLHCLGMGQNFQKLEKLQKEEMKKYSQNIEQFIQLSERNNFSSYHSKSLSIERNYQNRELSHSNSRRYNCQSQYSLDLDKSSNTANAEVSEANYRSKKEKSNSKKKSILNSKEKKHKSLPTFYELNQYEEMKKKKEATLKKKAIYSKSDAQNFCQPKWSSEKIGNSPQLHYDDVLPPQRKRMCLSDNLELKDEKESFLFRKSSIVYQEPVDSIIDPLFEKSKLLENIELMNKTQLDDKMEDIFHLRHLDQENGTPYKFQKRELDIFDAFDDIH